jgi:hypothetical protein
MPYSCKRMGFKSAVLPALEVLRVDGQTCHSFEAKIPTPSAPAAAPHDGKLWA